LVHRTSGRKGKFVVVHTPSIPETLFESELFGHKKGAFTGAGESKKGLVEEAAGGTLFLDEIAEIPISFQAKLLQLIDVKKYRVVGDSNENQADIRIIAASNRLLEEEVKQQRFRKDLFFRLSVLPIEIPPLRERKEDIKDIVNQYRYLLKGKQLDDSSWQVLYQYHWPGNVRELINLLKRAGIHLETTVIGKEIEAILQGNKLEEPVNHDFSSDRFYKAIAEGKSFWDSIWKEFLNREISRRDVLRILSKYYEENGHNLKAMSRSLNIKEKDYPRFISALHKYNVHPGKDK
jgi:transcriptional regulator with PAS, ATPase and Fis domain